MQIGDLLSTAVVALQDVPEPTFWHDLLVRLREGQTARALWLAEQTSDARRLALRLWRSNDSLTVPVTEAIVTGVLAPPVASRDHQHRPEAHR